MNYQRITFSLAFFSLLPACALDETSSDFESEADGEDIVVESEIIATVDLGHGELVYSVTTTGPMAGELLVKETSVPDKDGNLRLPDPTESTLERYLIATEDGTPIPSVIFDSEEADEIRALAAGRPLVDRIDEVLIAPASDGPLLSSATNAQMCAEGTTSASFANQICSMNSWWNKSFCHNGTWYGVTDDSAGYRAHWARSLTLACYANASVKHRYKAGAWYTSRYETIGSGQLHQYTTEGQVRLRRTIEHKRTASGFIRAASFFRHF